MAEKTAGRRQLRASTETLSAALLAECERLRGIVAAQDIKLNGIGWALATVGTLIENGYSQAAKALTDAAVTTYRVKHE